MIKEIKGRGERLVDQKASIKEIVDFFKNELPSIFGGGERAIDQQFSVKDVVNFFKNELPDLFKEVASHVLRVLPSCQKMEVE